MQSNYTRWKYGLSLSLFAAVIWAFLPIILKGLLGAMDTITITWYRFISAAVVVSIIIALKYRDFNWRKLRGQTLLLMLVAIVCLISNYVTFLLGLNQTTASSTEVMIQMAPMLLLLGGVIIFKESFSRLQFIGVCIFVGGLGLFFNHRWAEIIESFGSYRIGFLWILLSSIMWATYALAQKVLLARFSSFHAMFYIYAVGTFLLLPGAELGQIQRLSTLAWVLLALSCLNTLFAYGAFAEALNHWEASRVSAVLTLTPLLTILFVYFINCIFPNYIEVEPLNWISIVGAVLVVAGSMLAALAKAKADKT